jgi:hypothetical protein
LQFSFGLASKVYINPSKANYSMSWLKRVQTLIFGTEIWSLVFVLFLQDLPFSILRIIILIYYPGMSKNYTLYFFAAKNLGMAIVEIYIILGIIRKDIKKNKQIEVI